MRTSFSYRFYFLLLNRTIVRKANKRNLLIIMVIIVIITIKIDEVNISHLFDGGCPNDKPNTAATI